MGLESIDVRNKRMPKCIDRFDGEYAFLSNFYLCPVVYDGMMYSNSEAAFQAAKCASLEDRVPFTRMTPREAKKAGRMVELKPTWYAYRTEAMLEILRDKFRRTPALRRWLVATGDAELIEGNHWHDNYWGNCSCPRCTDATGCNMLGKLLMQVRKELKETS